MKTNLEKKVSFRGKHFSVWLPWLGLSISSALLAIYLILASTIQSASIRIPDRDRMQFTDCTSSDCHAEATLLVDFQNYEPKTHKLDFYMRLYPNSALGTAWTNGGSFSEALTLGYGSDSSSKWDIAPATIVGGRASSVELPELRNGELYPFDESSGEIGFILKSAVSGEAIPLKVSISNSDINGYSIASNTTRANDSSGFESSGYQSVKVSVARASSQIFLAFLLVVIIVIGALSSFVATIAIAQGHRPPSQAVLGWLATYLFALIEVRADFPGDPALGVMLDRVFTFPVTSTLLILIVWNSISWLRREDWDAKNTKE